MYSRAAFPLANLLSDMPFSALRIFVYDIIIYFMVGLHSSAGGFWTFHLFTYLTFLCMQSFFRTFGLCFQSYDIAYRLSVIFIPHIIQYCGYLLPEFLMKRWLFWIYYVDPLAYAWGGIMQSEFSRISLTCDGSYVVPRNAPGVSKYPDTLGPNQVCTLFGARPGSIIVPGSDYVSAGFTLNTKDLWRRNFLVLLGWFILFIFTQLLVIEYLQVGRGLLVVFASSLELTSLMS